MTFTAGATPLAMQVELSKDSDFDWVLTNTSGNWAVGEVLELHFNDAALTVWTATMAGAVATFHIDKTPVNTLIAAAPTYATLVRVLGTTDTRWAQGGVTING